jgi:CheY-like chemotaxis protein
MGKILIVDDEVDICAILTQQLQKLGFHTTYCLTIQDALSRVSQSDYDLIFVDLNLTDGSGYDLISTIQKHDRPVKIVVISAYDSERQKALQSGADLFVPKPFSRKAIEVALQRLNFLNS